MDLGLSLMASPHSSYPPLDLAAAGAVVVTNTFGRYKRSLDQYSANIICADPDLASLVAGISQGIALAQDVALREANHRSSKFMTDWNAVFASYRKSFPELAAEYERVQEGRLKDGWEQSLPQFPADGKPVATRTAGNTVMNAFVKYVPELLGGAADLSTSTKTVIKNSGNFHLDPTGQNIYFGVREFGMCAIVNGMAMHGGIIPYGSTFFNFSDYAKPAIRLAAIMQSHSIFVFTHDSIGLGEDGPTHQPVEQLTMLRAIPHLTDFRPADANETSAVWGLALERRGACFMALSRQDLPLLDPVRQRVFEGVRRGAYIVEQGSDSPDLLIVGTGSELWPAVRAAEQLKKDGIVTRVVSMPSTHIFDEQSESCLLYTSGAGARCA